MVSNTIMSALLLTCLVVIILPETEAFYGLGGLPYPGPTARTLSASVKKACQKLDTKCLRICAAMDLNYWECVNIHHASNAS